AELEGPDLVVIRMGPGQRELRHRLTLVVQRDQRIENRGGGGFRRGIVHTDLEGIEAGNVEFEANGDAAARFLGAGGGHGKRERKSRHKKYSRKRVRSDRRNHSMFPPEVSSVRYPGSFIDDGNIVWNRRRGQDRSRGGMKRRRA